MLWAALGEKSCWRNNIPKAAAAVTGKAASNRDKITYCIEITSFNPTIKVVNYQHGLNNVFTHRRSCLSYLYFPPLVFLFTYWCPAETLTLLESLKLIVNCACKYTGLSKSFGMGSKAANSCLVQRKKCKHMCNSSGDWWLQCQEGGEALPHLSSNQL